MLAHMRRRCASSMRGFALAGPERGRLLQVETLAQLRALGVGLARGEPFPAPSLRAVRGKGSPQSGVSPAARLPRRPRRRDPAGGRGRGLGRLRPLRASLKWPPLNDRRGRRVRAAPAVVGRLRVRPCGGGGGGRAGRAGPARRGCRRASCRRRSRSRRRRACRRCRSCRSGLALSVSRVGVCVGRAVAVARRVGRWASVSDRRVRDAVRGGAVESLWVSVTLFASGSLSVIDMLAAVSVALSVAVTRRSRSRSWCPTRPTSVSVSVMSSRSRSEPPMMSVISTSVQALLLAASMTHRR
jgi:hypothetical protein